MGAGPVEGSWEAARTQEKENQVARGKASGDGRGDGWGHGRGWSVELSEIGLPGEAAVWGHLMV